MLKLIQHDKMKTIPDIIETFKHRDKTAILYKTGFKTFTYSYKELYTNILKTQNYLEELGLKKGDKILLWGYNGPSWITVFLACARSGIVIIPIDYMATSDFVEKIQSQVKAKVIFHSEFKILPKLGIKQLIIGHLDFYIDKKAPSDNLPDIQSEDLLEIVFTSGTTAEPKGVILTHKNLVSNINAVLTGISINQDQTFLSLLPLSHLLEQNPGFLSPLTEGCTVVYIKGLRPNLIFKTLSEVRVTNIILVPRLLKLFQTGIMREVDLSKKTKTFNKLLSINLPLSLKKIVFSKVHKKFGTHFQYFVSGGAPLSVELTIFWNKLGFKIIEGYGLSESSPILTANTVEEPVLGSVGTPLPGVTLKIGNQGEILAKGDNITKGYFHNKEQTNALFDKGFMKTGDIGYLDDNKHLFIKGRLKDMIKTSAGINVYPQDIEKILLENKNVLDVCVLGIPTDAGEEVHAEIILKNPKSDIKSIVEEANLGLNDSQKILSFSKWTKDDFPRTTTMKIKKRFVLEEILKRGKKSNPKSQVQTHSKLYDLIAKINGINSAIIKPSSLLSLDLKLTSVNKIELISVIEQEFNVDIDEEEINAQTRISDIEKMLKDRKRQTDSDDFRRWTLSMPIRILRFVFNLIIGDNLIYLFCRRKVEGLENLENLNQPAIFIANHIGYFDAPNVLMSLPFGIRNKIATAAWKEYFTTDGNPLFKNKLLDHILWRFYYQYTTIFVNVYMFPKKTGFKRSLAYTGELLDKKWNILFFPEGEHSPDGTLQPFKSGIGWIAKEMRVPVVPIKHFGLEKIMAGDPHQIPKFGNVRIKIGKPVMPDYTKSIPEITQELHDLIEKM